MGLDFNYHNGQTPLDEEEKEGLLINTITIQGELNELEQLNIEKAVEWTVRNTFSAERILSERFVKTLHRRMFGEVWKWAGTFRKTNKNIGVNWPLVRVRLKNLLDDTVFWVEQKTYRPEEIAIRFKHRLVAIHCFPNGNGRHSRLMADVIMESVFGLPVFLWHFSSMAKVDETRKRYISALKQADNGNVEPLITFAKG